MRTEAEVGEAQRFEVSQEEQCQTEECWRATCVPATFPGDIHDTLLYALPLHSLYT